MCGTSWLQGSETWAVLVWKFENISIRPHAEEVLFNFILRLWKWEYRGLIYKKTENQRIWPPDRSIWAPRGHGNGGGEGAGQTACLLVRGAENFNLYFSITIPANSIIEHVNVEMKRARVTTIVSRVVIAVPFNTLSQDVDDRLGYTSGQKKYGKSMGSGILYAPLPMCCVLQCVAVCCSVLQCVAIDGSML